MNKIFYFLCAFAILAALSSCTEDQTSYADLVKTEENHIDYLLNREGFKTRNIDEETLKDWTNKVLKDSIDPAEFMDLGQWYQITEGSFKRLCFRINKWGDGRQRWLKWQAYQDSINHNMRPSVRPDSVSFYSQKMVSGSYVQVRYDSLFMITDTLDIHTALPTNNLEPYDYQLIYGWNEYYYASYYYSYNFGSTSSYTCTSGGLGFAPRFLWYGAEVSLIVPFSLVSQDLSSYYYTLYYGKVRYTKPNYLPE